MLRSTRQPASSLGRALLAVVAIVLVWPTAASATGARSTGGAGAAPEAPPAPGAGSGRAPTVGGRGTYRPTAGHSAPRVKGTLEPLIGPDTIARPAAPAGRGEGAGPGTASAVDPSVLAPAPLPVQVGSSGAPAASSIGWEGLSQANAPFEPPDPWVGVGPDHVVQTVNRTIRMSNREGGSPTDNDPPAAPVDTTLETFFRTDDVIIFPNTSPTTIDKVGSPRAIYDDRHGAWVILTNAVHCDDDGDGTADDALGLLLVSVSLTANPTGTYYNMVLSYGPFMPDFPAIGTSADKLTFGANEFLIDPTTCEPADNPDNAGSVWTFDWSNLLDDLPLFPIFDYFFSDTLFSLRPAQAPQATSNDIFVVGEDLSRVGLPVGQSDVAYLRISGTVTESPGGTSVTQYNLSDDGAGNGVVATFEEPPQPTQPGGAVGSAVIDRRPTHAIWQDNVLTFASTYPCDPSGGSSETRDCARIARLATTSTTSPPTRIEDMLIATSAKDTWMPGIGLSQSGTLHVVYSQSSSTEGISSFDRYQLRGDSPATLSTAIEIGDGGAVSYGGDRWGDFVGVAQDPRDTNAVWQGNQYAKSGGTWGTKVSELQTAGTTFIPIDPVRLLDSRVNNGTTGAFSANISKSVTIAGRGGIPADAVAITGNLTTVGQTKAGYVSITPVATTSPTVSTINFPVGDIRGNNVTSPLSTSGRVSLVYKAGSGRTDLVLDVTGYFLDDTSGATYKIVTPVRIVDSRPGPDNVGLAGPLASNVNHTFQVAGVATIPDNATAITANLAVVGQTKAGYITMTTNPPASAPPTATVNFPVGDIRANGITIKLSSTGKLTARYSAGSGATINIVLDVTGYYVAGLSGARFVPMTPGRRMDTRFSAPPEGLTGAFGANSARKLTIEPYQGVPASAIAITGNLTVVNQTKAGYVSITTAPTNDPATATMNFPGNDIRGNGVTQPLAGDGSVGLVFKASSGSTHLVLDVTGYFR